MTSTNQPTAQHPNWELSEQFGANYYFLEEKHKAGKGVAVIKFDGDIPCTRQTEYARLIARAPDLLEALKSVIDESDRNTLVYQSAKQLISKIEGSV